MANAQHDASPAPAQAGLFTPPNGQPWGLIAALVLGFIAFEGVAYVYDRLRNASGLASLGAQNALVHAADLLASWSVKFLALVVLVYLARMTLRDYLGWNRPRTFDLVLGVGIVVALWTAFAVAAMLTGGADVSEYRQAIAAGMSPWWFVLRWWPAILLAPFVEECFFRGFVWRSAEPQIGKWGALLLTSVLFAAIHYNYYLKDGVVIWGTVAQYILTALFFGWLRWKSGGTTVPMAAHAMSNALPNVLIVVMSAFTP